MILYFYFLQEIIYKQIVYQCSCGCHIFIIYIVDIHIFMRIIYLKQGLHDLHDSLGYKCLVSFLSSKYFGSNKSKIELISLV